MAGLFFRLTYANVVASLALFVALATGGAYAANQLIGSGDIARNAVLSKHIKRGSVKRGDLAANAVDTSRVANGSLLGEDFATGQLPVGAAGEQGPQGEQGPLGVPGENATKLFASVGDDADIGATAVLVYGSGITGVTDPNPGHVYMVTFAQSVQNCVVQAVAGVGDPPSNPVYAFAAIPLVEMNLGNAQQVSVSFETFGGTLADTSFMIAALC
jgi:hypothetical protein